MRRYELTDEQWELIADILPASEARRGCPWSEFRTIVNGMFWILFSGASWRDLPERYGPWQTVYNRFRRWQDDCTFDNILRALQMKLNDEGLLDWSLFGLDSTSVRANRAASGARKKKKRLGDLEPPDHALGRSRGGFGSKIHLVCDRQGTPLGAILSSAARHDSADVEDLLSTACVRLGRGRPRTPPEHLVADRTYDASRIRRYVQKRGIGVTMPEKCLAEKRQRRKRGPHPPLDKSIYKECNVVERLIGKLKECRRIMTRFDTRVKSFLTMIHLAFIKVYLNLYLSDRA